MKRILTLFSLLAIMASLSYAQDVEHTSPAMGWKAKKLKRRR